MLCISKYVLVIQHLQKEEQEISNYSKFCNPQKLSPLNVGLYGIANCNAIRLVRVHLYMDVYVNLMTGTRKL